MIRGAAPSKERHALAQDVIALMLLEAVLFCMILQSCRVSRMSCQQVQTARWHTGAPSVTSIAPG